jgi:hypothetical protein
MEKGTVLSSTDEEQKTETLSGIEVGGMVETEWMRFHVLTIGGRSSSFSALACLSEVVPACPEGLSTMVG